MPSVVVEPVLLAGFSKKVVPASCVGGGVLHRRNQNRLRPALQLCSDVVEYLFRWTAELEPNSSSLFRAVISYSQTCHDWRIIALSAKALWVRLIDFENRSYQWNEEMLRRSHPLPIHLSYHYSLSRGAKVLHVQLDHLDRIQTYSVGCPDTDWDILVSLLTRPAPSLEDLYITCYHSAGHPGSRSPIVPLSLFSDYAPNLRRLGMKECTVDFRSPLLRSLTSLRIMDLSSHNAPTVVEWLRHLRQMPSLVELLLQSAILPSRYQPADSNIFDCQGHMPHIVNLVLEAPLSDVSSLLRHLPMPTQCHWSLDCFHCAPGSELDKVLQVFSDGIHNAYSTDEPCHLLIAAHQSHIFLSSEIVTGELSSEVGVFVNFHPPIFHFWESLFPAIASGIAQAMPQVTSLELDIPSVLPSLLPLLRRASRLDTLVKLSAKMSKTLLPHLQVPLASGGIALPALDRIVFTDDGSMWGESFKNFLSFLRWRSQVGAPIRMVDFLRCMVLEDVVEELMSLGVDVESGTDGVRWQNF